MGYTCMCLCYTLSPFSGIDYTHPLFEGRAERGPDFIDDPPPPEGDPNGHGTHVAGMPLMYT